MRFERAFLRVQWSCAQPRLAAFVMVVLAPLTWYTPLLANDQDVRAVWISQEALESADAVRRVVASAASSGANTVVVPLPLTVLPRAFDGPAEAIREARTRGLRVYGRIDVSRAAGHDELPSARDHLLYQHPEWLMVPREIAVEMLGVDLRSPEYVGRLARWTRANGEQADALYVSPLHPAAVTYVTHRVASALTRYVVDGVHLEGLRVTAAFDYSRGALDGFRAEIRAGLTPAERARMDAIEPIDPFAYPEEFFDRWEQYREARVTSLLVSVSTAVRQALRGAVITATVASDRTFARREHLQDWATWVDLGLVDALVEPPAGALTRGRRAATLGSH